MIQKHTTTPHSITLSHQTRLALSLTSRFLGMLCTCMMLLSSSSSAQLNRSAFGLFGHYVIASHSADFQALPTIPCCSPVFHSGKGHGIDLGLLYQTPINSGWLLSARLGYLNQTALFEQDEPRTFNVNGSAVPGSIHHQVDATLAKIYVEPLVGYRATERLTFLGGVMIGMAFGQSFTQTEEVTSPAGGQLTTPPAVGSGDLPAASALQASLSIGASYDIPLGRGSVWFLTPELFYSHALTNVVADSSWKAHSLRLGIALKYSPSQISLPDAPAGQKDLLVAAVKAYGMQSPDASEEDALKIRVEEFLARTHKPLLPYVFFGAGSGELPLQYRQMAPGATSTFQPEKFNDSSLLAVYYDVLNIVGKRLRDRPSAKISLVGCNSNETTERVNLQLSQRRAEVVKNYLVSVWAIDPTRIDTKARNLPANPSNINKEEGNAENRRVELSSNDPEILAPLVTRDTLRIANPPIIRFHTSVRAAAEVGSYSLAASQDSRLIQAFNGRSDVPETLDWHLDENATSMPRSETPLQYTLSVIDKKAQSYSTDAQSIAVEQITIEKKRRERIGDKEIDRYTLMSFGYSQADVEPDNQLYLQNIKKEMSPSSSVYIVGSTDTMGDPQFNQNLSEQRANAVAKVLAVRGARVEGVGETSMFDNAVPEGRFYNRTVRMRVETPVN